jgi:hypothetical protein
MINHGQARYFNNLLTYLDYLMLSFEYTDFFLDFLPSFAWQYLGLIFYYIIFLLQILFELDFYQIKLKISFFLDSY